MGVGRVRVGGRGGVWCGGMLGPGSACGRKGAGFPGSVGRCGRRRVSRGGFSRGLGLGPRVPATRGVVGLSARGSEARRGTGGAGRAARGGAVGSL